LLSYSSVGSHRLFAILPSYFHRPSFSKSIFNHCEANVGSKSDKIEVSDWKLARGVILTSNTRRREFNQFYFFLRGERQKEWLLGDPGEGTYPDLVFSIVSITSPANNSIVTGTIDIMVVCSDNTEVALFRLDINEKRVFQDDLLVNNSVVE
jgi:hypothetical protein